MTAYYNEHDIYAAQWLRNLIAAGHIAPGDVDERSIEDVRPSDLAGYTQCHFFAGIGVWSLALRRAGWPDCRPVWTGSCPCQPFSAAGQGLAFADERHLWPAFHHLIAERRPVVVFGEQVSGKDTDPWIDLVQDDMEGLGYPFGAVPFPAASVGAPQLRDRMYWVADAGYAGPAGGMGDPANDGQHGGRQHNGCNGKGQRRQAAIRGVDRHEVAGPGLTGGRWADCDWISCADGRARPVEPGTFPLAHGATARVGRLRAYGNAINAAAAEEFIRAHLGA